MPMRVQCGILTKGSTHSRSAVGSMIEVRLMIFESGRPEDSKTSGVVAPRSIGWNDDGRVAYQQQGTRQRGASVFGEGETSAQTPEELDLEVKNATQTQWKRPSPQSYAPAFEHSAVAVASSRHVDRNVGSEVRGAEQGWGKKLGEDENEEEGCLGFTGGVRSLMDVVRGEKKIHYQMKMNRDSGKQQAMNGNAQRGAKPVHDMRTRSHSAARGDTREHLGEEGRAREQAQLGREEWKTARDMNNARRRLGLFKDSAQRLMGTGEQVPRYAARMSSHGKRRVVKRHETSIVVDSCQGSAQKYSGARADAERRERGLDNGSGGGILVGRAAARRVWKLGELGSEGREAMWRVVMDGRRGGGTDRKVEGVRSEG
ncbi:hypothetical protein C8R46DRAFT_1037668 [Mycena filopes]|nr:hypothetical protein C8R46DRAFT_1037668 [Mycena filopes]